MMTLGNGQNNEKRTFGVSGFTLKLIAVITMIIDHIGYVLFPGEIAFRVVGRMAFPIYCFLIVEGFFHTSNLKKYIIRLGLFAVISEIPFNMMISGKGVDLLHQNVFFTLLIGLVTIYCIQMTLNQVLKSVALAMGMFVALVLKTDYSLYGVLIIYIFYEMREKRALACTVMSVVSFLKSTLQGTAVTAAVPIFFYNGKKGPAFADKKIWKYGFYAIYPIHILVLYIIATHLGG